MTLAERMKTSAFSKAEWRAALKDATFSPEAGLNYSWNSSGQSAFEGSPNEDHMCPFRAACKSVGKSVWDTFNLGVFPMRYNQFTSELGFRTTNDYNAQMEKNPDSIRRRISRRAKLIGAV